MCCPQKQVESKSFFWSSDTNQEGTVFHPIMEHLFTLKSHSNTVKVLAEETTGATWFVYMLIIKSQCKASKAHSRDPSADRHKNTKSLYKATASSARHFKAKAGQVSQVIFSSQQPIYYLKLQWLSRTAFSPALGNQLNHYQSHLYSQMHHQQCRLNPKPMSDKRLQVRS